MGTKIRRFGPFKPCALAAKITLILNNLELKRFFSKIYCMSWIKWYNILFGEKFKHQLEALIIKLSIIGFGLHLVLIALYNLNWLQLPFGGSFFSNPISALYTPFSFIIVWEVYQLVEQLPRSFTSSVQKQFEIIALILIRRVFKDIAQIDFNEDWISSPENYSLAIDIIAFLLLFLLIFTFKRLRRGGIPQDMDQDFQRFIAIKKSISVCLVPVLAGLIFFELFTWIQEIVLYSTGASQHLSDVNAIFYHDFFVILIWVDVLILLISLNFIQGYSQLIRNSGYIVSTVLIRLSFTTTGAYNSLLILVGVGFGVALLYIFNLIRKQEEPAH